LSTVADTAEVVLDEALSVVMADAGAVLVRDGLRWRVAAGRELRALEHRAELEPDHWLVRQVSESWHGLLIAGGEGQLPELYGAPLSARPFLLAAPVSPVGAILMLARDQEEFIDTDLERLQQLTEEAGHLLYEAIDVRRLARLLRPFCDDRD
jgi:hypothetical protein